jgi:hypothetical protein
MDGAARTLAIPKEPDLHEAETIKSHRARSYHIVSMAERYSYCAMSNIIPLLLFLVPFFCDLHATSSSLLICTVTYIWTIL